MSIKRPKYVQIVDQLVRDIRDGSYKVGDMLPPEYRLMEAYSVSRHTVRQALQSLKQMGLIQAQQGKGSIVVAKANPSAYVDMIQSIEALISKGGDLDRRHVQTVKVMADEKLADSFTTHVGREFSEIHLVRYTKESPHVPAAYLKIWIDPIFGSLADELNHDDRTVAEIMDQHFGLEIGSIRQSITSIPLCKSVASYLKQPEGTPALQIERLYSSTALEPAHLRTISICRADLVQIDSHFQSR